MLGFLEGGKLKFPGGKNPRSKARTSNSTNIWHKARIDPGPHWGKGNALAGTSPLSFMTQITFLLKLNMQDSRGKRFSRGCNCLAFSFVNISFVYHVIVFLVSGQCQCQCLEKYELLLAKSVHGYALSAKKLFLDS